MAPPFGIMAAARFAASVNEKQEITIVRTKLSRVVSAYRPVNWALSEKPMA